MEDLLNEQVLRLNFTYDINNTNHSFQDILDNWKSSLFVYDEPQNIILITCYVPLIILAAFSNVLVIYIINRYHSLRR